MAKSVNHGKTTHNKPTCLQLFIFMFLSYYIFKQFKFFYSHLAELDYARTMYLHICMYDVAHIMTNLFDLFFS